MHIISASHPPALKTESRLRGSAQSLVQTVKAQLIAAVRPTCAQQSARPFSGSPWRLKDDSQLPAFPLEPRSNKQIKKTRVASDRLSLTWQCVQRYCMDMFKENIMKYYKISTKPVNPWQLLFSTPDQPFWPLEHLGGFWELLSPLVHRRWGPIRPCFGELWRGWRVHRCSSLAPAAWVTHVWTATSSHKPIQHREPAFRPTLSILSWSSKKCINN